MIPIEAIQQVKTIVVHRCCADGIAAALLLKDALPGATVWAVAYGSDIHRGLSASPGMLFCDITPPRERMEEFRCVGAIVLDHHHTARDIVEAFGPLGVFGDEKKDPGVSGAVLAYREVWSRVPEKANSLANAKRLSYLVGVRDTWQRASPDWEEACRVSEALRFYPLTWWFNASPTKKTEMLGVGRVLVERNHAAVKRALDEGIRLDAAGGARVFLVNDVGVTSDLAEALGADVDLVIGYRVTNGPDAPVLRLSLRSHTGVDCAAIARTLGGGGHSAAAGCSVAYGLGSAMVVRFILNRVVGALDTTTPSTDDER